MQALHRTLHVENTEAFTRCCPEYIRYLAAPSPSAEQGMVQAGQPTAWQEPVSPSWTDHSVDGRALFVLPSHAQHLSRRC